MVEFLSTKISAIVSRCEVEAYGVIRDDVGRSTELHRGLVFAFGGDNLGATFAFGLGLLSVRAAYCPAEQSL